MSWSTMGTNGGGGGDGSGGGEDGGGGDGGGGDGDGKLYFVHALWQMVLLAAQQPPPAHEFE